MRSAAPRLHPMGLGELLDTTFALCRANFPLFAGIVAVLAVPKAVLSAGVQLATPSPTSATITGTTAAVGPTGGPGVFVVLGASIMIALVFNSVITGALAQAISARYLGRPITIGQAFSSVGLSTLAWIALATIVEGIILIPALALFVVPAVYLFVRFLFIPQAIVLERCSIGGAFTRSGRLVRGSWWRVAGYGLALFVLVAVIQTAIGGVIVAALAFGIGTGGRIAAAVVSALLSLLIQPFQFGALTLLYYDLRIRKEGFDLEHLAGHLD